MTRELTDDREEGPTRPDLLANAIRATNELHRLIDHQSEDSDKLDTKSQAIFALIATGAAIIGARSQIDTTPRTVAALALVFLVLAAAFCALRVMQPRDESSYGADPDAVRSLLTSAREVELALGIANAIADSRDVNVEFLRNKQRWLKREFLLFQLAALAAAVFGASGAVT